MNPVAMDAINARQEGRYEEALRLLQQQFDQVSAHNYFITMSEWTQLAEEYPPAQAALAAARDEQARRLLDGDATLFVDRDATAHSRFQTIVNINETLNDNQATYALFVQLLSAQPALARHEAFLALPAVVEAGDFALAEHYIGDPLPQLAELNRLSHELPLFPERGKAPRLAAELSNFMTDVILRLTVLQGLGREDEAEALCRAALAGLESDDMRELGLRELTAPGTIIRTLASATK